MDFGVKCKIQNYKAFRKKNRRKYLGSRAKQRFLRLDAKSTICKRKKIINKPYQNLKTFVL